MKKSKQVYINQLSQTEFLKRFEDMPFRAWEECEVAQVNQEVPPNNRTLVCDQFTSIPQRRPQAHKIANLSELFECFKPEVKLLFEGKKEFQETLNIKNLDGFGPEGLIKKSKFLSNQNLKKGSIENLLCVLKSSNSIKRKLNSNERSGVLSNCISYAFLYTSLVNITKKFFRDRNVSFNINSNARNALFEIAATKQVKLQDAYIFFQQNIINKVFKLNNLTEGNIICIVLNDSGQFLIEVKNN